MSYSRVSLQACLTELQGKRRSDFWCTSGIALCLSREPSRRGFTGTVFRRVSSASNALTATTFDIVAGDTLSLLLIPLKLPSTFLLVSGSTVSAFKGILSGSVQSKVDLGIGSDRVVAGYSGPKRGSPWPLERETIGRLLTWTLSSVHRMGEARKNREE